MSSLILALASCTSEMEEAVSSQKVPLQIQVEIENSSRAANVADTDFKEGESIAIYVDNASGANAKESPWYRYVATYKKGIWEFENPVFIEEDKYIMAFYPADCEVSMYPEFVYMWVNVGTNHMGAECKVQTENPSAKLMFRHTMARVQFEVKNPDAQPLSSIKISGKDIWTTGLWHGDGVKPDDYADKIISIDSPSASPTVMQFIDVPFIPGSKGNATLTLNYEDGKSYRTELNFPKLEMGHYYIVPVTISKGEEGNGDPEAFTITTSIQDWTEENMNELEITNKNVVE